MPKVLIYRNIIFLIFSIDKFEKRIHIHIAKKSVKGFAPANFWLEPEIKLAVSGDFSTKELNVVSKLIYRFEKEIKDQIEQFFAGKKIKTIKING